MLNETIIHHTALAHSGGAARVAQLIMKGLGEKEHNFIHSFEISEKDNETPISPSEAAKAIPENSIVHLHSSTDPAQFLNALPKSAKIVITFHDVQMLTGGCPHPMDCPHFEKDCLNPCPRNFPDSEAVRKKNISALLNSKAQLVSPSKWLAELAKKAHKDLKAKIIPNGIPWPPNIGDKKQARRLLGLHPQAGVVLFIAHGGEKAGYKSGPKWLEYWSLIKKNSPEAVAFAIGGDQNSRHGDFITVPYLDREKLNIFMQAADILVYPTLADNHPLVILEAMSNALPTVSYAVGGVPEQIIDGENGILVEPFKKQIMAETVSGLLRKRHFAAKLGNAGFHNGKNKFNYSRMVKDYLKIYYKLV